MQELECGATQRRDPWALYCPPQSCEVGEGGIQSQDMKIPQKELEQLARPLKPKRSTVGHM